MQEHKSQMLVQLHIMNNKVRHVRFVLYSVHHCTEYTCKGEVKMGLSSIHRMHISWY